MTDPLYIYITVISDGPLMIMRVPAKGRRGRRKPEPQGRLILQAVRAVLREHGFAARSLYGLEAYAHPDVFDPAPDNFWSRPKTREEELRAYQRAGEAFAGDYAILPTFLLYDWHAGDRAFVLARDVV
jgi:hypothetical protein